MMKLNKITIFILTLTSFLFLQPSLIYALPPQQSNPVADCEQGLTLYRNDKEAALPLLKAAVADADDMPLSTNKAACAFDLGYIYTTKNNHEAALTAYQLALETYQALDHLSGQALTLRNLAIVYARQADYAKAIDFDQQALIAYQELEDVPTQADILRSIAFAYYNLEDTENTLDTYQQALALYRELDDLDNQALILKNIGSIHYSLEDYDETIETYQQTLDIYQALKDAPNQALILRNIGHIYSTQEAYDKAIEYYQQSLDLYQDLTNFSEQANALEGLGDVYRKQEEYAEAVEPYEQAITLYLEVDELETAQRTMKNLATSYNELGRYYRSKDNLAAASIAYEQAALLYETLQDALSQAEALRQAGNAYNMQDKYAEASVIFEQVTLLYQNLEDIAAEADALETLSFSYAMQEEYAKSSTVLEQALTLYQTLKDVPRQADILEKMGRAYRYQEKYAEGLVAYQQAIKLYLALDDQQEVKWALQNIAWIYRDQENFDEAANVYQQLLAYARETDDNVEELRYLNDIAYVYERGDNDTQAYQYYQQALTLSQALESQAGIIDAYIDLGRVSKSLGDYPQSLSYNQQALTLSQEIGLREQEARALIGLGALARDEEDFDLALSFFEQALAINRERGDVLSEVGTLSAIKRIYEAQGRVTEAEAIAAQIEIIDAKSDAYIEQLVSGMSDEAVGDELASFDKLRELTALQFQGIGAQAVGDTRLAAEIYEKAVEVAREMDDQEIKAETLLEVADIYIIQGRYQAALEASLEALLVAAEAEDQAHQGTAFNNIGDVFRQQGRYKEALEVYLQALTLNQQMGNQPELGQSFYSIGQVYQTQTHYEDALEAYQLAQDIFVDLDDLDGQLAVLNNIGQVYARQEAFETALETFSQAADLIGDRLAYRHRAVDILNNIAEVYTQQGKYQEALELFETVFQVNMEMDNPLDEATNLMNMGQIYEIQENYPQALNAYESALTRIESVRASAGSQQGRITFIAQYIQLYHKMINLYHQQGDDENAFFVAERSRARAFLDSLSDTQIQLSDAEAADLLIEAQMTYVEIEQLKETLTEARILNPQLVEGLETQLSQAKTAYAAIQTAIEARGDQLADLAYGQDLKNVLTVSQVQALLNSQTTLVNYYLLEEKTLVFLITHNQFQTIELDISAAQLADRITDFREAINPTNATDSQTPAQELYQDLIAPFANQLNTPRLMIIPHKALHYLPFAALQNPNSNRYLLEDYELVMLPSASVLPFIQPTGWPNLHAPLILGNPTLANPAIATLPFAELEAKTVAEFYGTKPLLATAATESAVRERASTARFLHLAAHGSYNPAAPLYSLLLLAPDETHDGLLTASEVYELDLHQTDMVILSACETQLGELSAGDDVVGLTRAFMFAGSPTVVASLWSVNDAATGLLMITFHQHLRKGLSKAAALRQAQLDLLHNRTFASPFYWAAFVMSGDDGAEPDKSDPLVATTTPPTDSKSDIAVDPTTAVRSDTSDSTSQTESLKTPPSAQPWGGWRITIIGIVLIAGLVAVRYFLQRPER